MESKIEMRTEKFWQIYTIAIGADLSFLPFLIYSLVFQAKIRLFAAVLLWLLTTAVLLEDWWTTEETLTSHPNDSRVIVIIGFCYLLGLLCLPAVLLGTT
jgi:hypothetical protein